MKVITIKQPFAALIVRGIKAIETRPWYTDHRGPLLIHSSKGIMPGLPFTDLVPFTEWITGCIIGQVDVVAVERVEDILCRGITDTEKRVGDFTPGRWGFRLANPIKFEKPIPAQGQLGLWNYNL